MGGWVNPLKKEYLWHFFFLDVEWSSKNWWKTISADVKKANIKQQGIKT